jgi:hypothetical protein
MESVADASSQVLRRQRGRPIFVWIASRLTANRLASVICATFVGLAVFMSMQMPLYQGNDESWHMAYVDHFAQGRGLPDLNSHYLSGRANAPYWQTHEASQPPLYYGLAALVVRWIPRGDMIQQVTLESNAPNGMYGNFLREDDSMAARGLARAGHAARIVSVLFGLLLVWSTYRAALILTDDTAFALLALCLTAFNPKHIWLASQVSNDIAVAGIGALAVWIMLKQLHNARSPSVGSSVLLGVLCGLALLTKYNALALVPGAALVFVACMRRHADYRMHCLQHASGLLAGFLLTTGWFFVRNQTMYGDPLALSRVDAMNARFATRSLAELLPHVPYMLETHFGHPANLFAAIRTYNSVMVDVILVAFAGGILMAWRRAGRPEYAVLGAILVTNIVAHAIWMRNHIYTENTRFFAASFAPISLLISAGLLAWLPKKVAGISVLAACFALASFALISFPITLPQIFARASYLSVQDAQPFSGTTSVKFSNGIEMADVSLASSRLDPGLPVVLTIVWRTTAVITTPAHLAIDVRTPDGDTLGHLNTANATRYSYAVEGWGIQRYLRETYTIAVQSVDKSTLADVYLGWYDQVSGASVLPTDREGNTVHIARVKVRAQQRVVAEAPQTVLAHVTGLGDIVALSRAGERLTIRLHATAESTQNYTIFAHARALNGDLVTQRDAPFDAPSAYWDVGDAVTQTLVLPGLAAAPNLEIGIYEPNSGKRLELTSPNGEPLRDQILRLKLSDVPTDER